MNNDDEYILDEQIGYVLRLVSQRHATIFQLHAEYDLTPTQFSTLIRLSEVGSCSQNHLGRLISVDVATIKGVIDRLNKKGLIEMKADPSDGRRIQISLTAEIREKVATLYNMGKKITEETLRPLSPPERKRLQALLKKIS